MRTSASRRHRPLPKPDRCEATGKVRWPDGRSAVTVLHLSKNAATRAAAEGLDSRRNEVRHYRCEHCHGFHTTSLAEFTQVASQASA